MGTESESGLLEMVKTKERILKNQSKTPQADSCIKRAAGEGDSIPEVALAPLQHCHSACLGNPLLGLPASLRPRLLPEAFGSEPRELLPLGSLRTEDFSITWNSCRVGPVPTTTLLLPYLVGIMSGTAQDQPTDAPVVLTRETDPRARGWSSDRSLRKHRCLLTIRKPSVNFESR